MPFAQSPRPRTAASSSFPARSKSEMAGLSDEEAREFCAELGIERSGLDELALTAYDLLGLMTFLTAGEKEVRAWTIERGTKAPQAAGKIHSDIERGFIRAEIVSYDDYVAYKTMEALRDGRHAAQRGSRIRHARGRRRQFPLQRLTRERGPQCDFNRLKTALCGNAEDVRESRAQVPTLGVLWRLYRFMTTAVREVSVFGDGITYFNEAADLLRTRFRDAPNPDASRRVRSFSRSPFSATPASSKSITGYRVQYQLRARPGQRRHPLPSRRDARRSDGACVLDDVEVRGGRPAVRRRKGRRHLRPVARFR